MCLSLLFSFSLISKEMASFHLQDPTFILELWSCADVFNGTYWEGWDIPYLSLYCLALILDAVFRNVSSI